MNNDLANHSKQVIDSTGTKDVGADIINNRMPLLEETVDTKLDIFDRIYVPDEFDILFPVDDDLEDDITFNVFD